MNRRITIISLLFALANISCSSSEANETVCSAGATRVCVGPGACQGGQVCAADGKWSACDCGGNGGAGSGGSGNGGTGNAGAPPFACPAGLPGPRLVKVPAPDGTEYCVDSTEVSGPNYAEFLAAAPAATPANQDARCSWNTSFDDKLVTGVLRSESSPVFGVDWCDAMGYCRWAGKHLCGKIGGGSLDRTTEADPTISEWYNACSAGGTRVYSYGDVADSTACPYTLGAGTCEGGYPGIFGMGGGAAEWTDECDVEYGSDFCAQRGGERASCGYTGNGSAADVTEANNLRGFRCCYRVGDSSS